MGDGMDMDMGDMEMVMTFGKWSDYKLKLLWDDWDITSRVEFGFSWLLVFMMGVVYHLIKFYIMRTEDDMRKVSASGHQTLLEHENGAVNNTRNSKAEEGASGNGLTASALMDSSSPSNAMVILRVKHAALAAIHYALALLLMLVAMTYNPCLFLACCLGYGAGDYAFTNTLLFSSRSGISNYACH